MLYDLCKKVLTITALLSVIVYFVWCAFFKESNVTQTQYQAMRTESYNVNNNENVNVNLMFSTLAEGKGWAYTNEKFITSEELIKFMQSRLSFFQQMYCKPVFTGGPMYLLYPYPTTGVKTNTYVKTTIETNVLTTKQSPNGLRTFFKSRVSMEGNSNDGSRP